MSLLTDRPAAHTDTKQAVTGRDGVKINSAFILIPLVSSKSCHITSIFK